jgi:thiamine-phosphate pyrophosphorylase
MKKNSTVLMLVTHKGTEPTGPYLDFVRRCVEAGVTCVQLREKSLSPDDLYDFGSALKELLDANNIPLIINDRVELCLALDAAGVHLGQSDGDVVEARSVLGPNKIIGLTVNHLEEVKNSRQQPIDYLGVSAIFPTHHKANVENVWGLEGLRQAARVACHPTVAIGGIDENNAFQVIEAGADGIAVIGALHRARDPEGVARHLIRIIQEARIQEASHDRSH